VAFLVAQVFATICFAIAFGGATGAGVALVIGLLALTYYLGWTRDLFGRQRIYASAWMWIAPMIVLVPIALRVFGIGWEENERLALLPMLMFGLLVGFTEEVAFRGIGVKMLRRAGYNELAVAAVTSTVFGLSHIPILLSKDHVVAMGVLQSSAFGVLMYLTLRATGYLASAILLHAFWNTAIWMENGWRWGIPSTPAAPDLLQLATDLTYLPTILAAGALLVFVRGRTLPTERPVPVPVPEPPPEGSIPMPPASR